jgi:dTDP-4-dehydrorhamnose reductase
MLPTDGRWQMRILVLGADGMLGHQLTESLRKRHDVIGTLRNGRDAYEDITAFLPDTAFFNVDARNTNCLTKILAEVRPDAVVNAIGIVKQRPAAYEAIESIEVNALLPHRLALSCAEINARLVHLSTDCVFSGRKGMYRESDVADANDLYGRTKLLGEVSATNCITLRSSIIGLELARNASLVEWFLAQEGSIKGFRRAIYSGVTTQEMARIIEMLLTRFPQKSGLYHVSSEPIDKHSLLCSLRARVNKTIKILPEDEFSCDRSMDSSRFREEFSYCPPSWDSMLDELAKQIGERRK